MPGICRHFVSSFCNVVVDLFVAEKNFTYQENLMFDQVKQVLLAVCTIKMNELSTYHRILRRRISYH